MGQARTEDERAFVERLYDEALEEGPDFTNYRAKSLFQAAPKLGIDRNAYARILNALEMIERGIYRNCRDKGKQGVPRTVARVLKALLNLALKYGEVRQRPPSAFAVRDFFSKSSTKPSVCEPCRVARRCKPFAGRQSIDRQPFRKTSSPPR